MTAGTNKGRETWCNTTQQQEERILVRLRRGNFLPVDTASMSETLTASKLTTLSGLDGNVPCGPWPFRKISKLSVAYHVTPVAHYIASTKHSITFKVAQFFHVDFPLLRAQEPPLLCSF
jgi:hypothetical protein